MGSKKGLESTLWKTIQPLFPKSASVNRIESHSTSIGFPDVEFCIDGCVGALELKAVASLSEHVHVRPSQVGWFRRRMKAGGKPILLLWIADIDNYYLLRGTDLFNVDCPTNALEYVDNCIFHFDRDELNAQFIEKLKSISHCCWGDI